MNKILLIDDEESTRTVFSDFLRFSGFDPAEASSGKEGIDLFSEERPDAVLLDLLMPGMDGIETLKELKRIDPDIPVIIVTAHGDVSTAVEAIKLGAYDFIVKPPDFKTLPISINRAIERLRLARQKAVVETQLREKEKKYRNLVETAHDVIWSLDSEGRITFVNSAVRSVYGYDPQEMIGRPFTDFMPLEQARENYRLFKHDPLPIILSETEVLRKDGTRITVSTNAVILQDDRGNVTGITGTSKDITQRKKAEEVMRKLNEELEKRVHERTAELAASNKELEQEIAVRRETEIALKEKTRLTRILLDSFSCVALLLRPSTREIVLSNEAGVKVGAVPGKTCYETWGQRKSACPWCLAPALWATGEARHLEIEARGIFWDAHWIPVSDDLYMHYAIDITERKKAEELLRKYSKRLRDMEEEQRRRFSRKLHDEIGPDLTALGINLNILSNKLPDDLLMNFGSRLLDSIAIVENITRQLRTIMTELHTPLLDEYGLPAALRWYGELFSHRTGLIVELRGDDRMPRLSQSAETNLFRIAQEALNNIAKHAKAKNVTVTLESSADTARLIIADDGIGFDVDKTQKTKGVTSWGLMGMKERVESEGGNFRFESSPGRGTKIVVEIKRGSTGD